MTYTALYRRYRPEYFSQLVGQAHIAKVLSAAVSRGGFVHAYLFCGPRGTGKTSAARILARAINCQQPTAAGEPCGHCPACKRALSGESLDLIEIDSASNRGIDEIRDLRERVKYAPAQEQYKIYIIDEVHMLTTEAFNALLKTLEEPPAHVIFILATTAPHKLPLTVLSRCQRFDFRRIGAEDIREHLLDIAAKENISISEDAAALIARKADGGMRDAVSLLDQCSGAAQSGSGSIDIELVSMLLGVVDHSFILRLQQHLLEKQIAPALQDVEELIASGKDLRQAVSDLCESLRDSLLRTIARPEQAAFPANVYLELLSALADTDNKLRFAASPRITLELALLKACGVQQAPVFAPAKPQPAASKPQPRPQPAPQRQTEPPQRQQPQPAPVTQPPAPQPEAAPAPLQPVIDPAGISKAELWKKVLEALESIDRCVYFRVEDCRLEEKDGVLLLRFPADQAENYRSVMGSQEYRASLDQAFTAVLGLKPSFKGEVGDFLTPEEGEEEQPQPQPEERQPAEPAAQQGSLFG